MRLAMIGAGGFRTPLVYRSLLNDHKPGRVEELRLFDISEHRLNAMVRVMKRQARSHFDAPKLVVCSSLAQAVDGADFVFSAIRVGGTHGRAADERIGLDNGVIGQETVGAGGIAYALRTIPVAREMAATIARKAPNAWVINFTNPAGVITQAMAEILGERVIGICDSPVGLARHALGALGLRDTGDVSLDYLGLNHLGWLRELYVNGEPRMASLLADDERLTSFEEGKLFGARWLQNLGALPNEYLYYYYFTREQLAADQHADEPRGAYLARQQHEFYECFHHEVSDPLDVWERARLDREETYMATNREAAGGFDRAEDDLESGGYDRVALALMRALSRDEETRLILNVPNHGTIPTLADDDIIEMPVRVSSGGIERLPVSPLGLAEVSLVGAVKACEREALRAAREKSYRAAWKAYALHPLIDSAAVGKTLLDDYIRAHDGLAYLA